MAERDRRARLFFRYACGCAPASSPCPPASDSRRRSVCSIQPDGESLGSRRGSRRTRAMRCADRRESTDGISRTVAGIAVLLDARAKRRGVLGNMPALRHAPRPTAAITRRPTRACILPLHKSHGFTYVAEVGFHGPVLLTTLDIVERVRRGDLVKQTTRPTSATGKKKGRSRTCVAVRPILLSG